MIPVIIKNLEIGTGIPKICIPNIGKTKKEILANAAQYKDLPMDIMEWRADWFDEVQNISEVTDVLKELHNLLPDTPLLYTFRTKKEGGMLELDPEQYTALAIAAADSGYADLIDVELFTGDTLVRSMITSIHNSGAKVIVSSHDFEKTPCAEELLDRLRRMQALDADILKIAVMPHSAKDVLTLLSVTDEMHSHDACRPLITMSMAGTGGISRIAGEIFGSSVTFGAGTEASAPGQLNAATLSEMLKTIHSAL